MKLINEIQNAPKAIGPYSPVVITGNLAFCSGQIPINPSTGTLIEGGIEEQTVQVLKNIKAVLRGVNLELNSIVKTTIFLKDLSHFQIVNKIYGETLGDHKPARSTIQIAKLPMDSLIEIEVIAEVL